MLVFAAFVAASASGSTPVPAASIGNVGGGKTGKRAFYALFEPMLRVPGEWPSAYEQFRDGVIILDPFNATAATVASLVVLPCTAHGFNSTISLHAHDAEACAALNGACCCTASPCVVPNRRK